LTKGHIGVEVAWDTAATSTFAPPSLPHYRTIGGRAITPATLVIVIEDDEQNLDLVTLLLEKHGCRVVAARDGTAGSDDALLTVDRQWRLTFFDTRAEQILRKALPEREDFIGTALQHALPELIASVPMTSGATLPAQSPREPFETFFAPTESWYAVHTYPCGDGLSLLLHDITARKRETETLRQLNDRLEERVAARTAEIDDANKELAALNYAVSHDLRAPLRVINGFSNMLIEDYGETMPPEALDHVRRIHANTSLMGELIDGLLSLSRATRGELHVEAVDMSAIANAIVDKLRKRQPERAVDVIIAPQIVVNGDANLLRVVLENLIGNAWKFTSKHPHARIEFGVSSDEGEAAYFVRDDGAGFDSGYADKLFKAFQRLHPAGEFDGTGIGLATVKRVIDRHNGRVWSRSSVGEGATFYFTVAVPASTALR